jgi:hypothetical protein
MLAQKYGIEISDLLLDKQQTMLLDHSEEVKRTVRQYTDAAIWLHLYCTIPTMNAKSSGRGASAVFLSENSASIDDRFDRRGDYWGHSDGFFECLSDEINGHVMHDHSEMFVRTTWILEPVQQSVFPSLSFQERTVCRERTNSLEFRNQTIIVEQCFGNKILWTTRQEVTLTKFVAIDESNDGVSV